MKYELRQNKFNEMDLLDPLFDAIMFGDEYKKGIFETDIEEKDKGYKLSMNVPGIDKKDLKISLNNGYLKVAYEHKEQNKENRNFIRKERKFESYSRSFYLGNVKSEDIKARLTNGVLEIYVPKNEAKDELNYIEIN